MRSGGRTGCTTSALEEALKEASFYNRHILVRDTKSIRFRKENIKNRFILGQVLEVFFHRL